MITCKKKKQQQQQEMQQEASQQEEISQANADETDAPAKGRKTYNDYNFFIKSK